MNKTIWELFIVRSLVFKRDCCFLSSRGQTEWLNKYVFIALRIIISHSSFKILWKYWRRKNQVGFNLRLQEVMPTSQLWLLFHEISWSTRNCYWLVGLFHFQYWTLGQGERRQLKSNYAEVGLRLPMISKWSVVTLDVKMKMRNMSSYSSAILNSSSSVVSGFVFAVSM